VKVVLDTNALVSALLGPVGPPSQVLALALAGRVTVLYNNRILLEYRDVLSLPKFAFPTTILEPILEFLEAEGEQVLAEPHPAEFEDEEDRAFCEVAASGEAAYLVTGNPKHYPRNSRVVSPREFLQQYRKRRRTRR
jgi:putative PIN family toxin of toxin-antitoxin system